MTAKEQQAVDESLAGLSIEQRIAVKAQLMRAGLWQNAAESLPAAPEQELPVAGVLSHEEHRRACMFNLPAAVFGAPPKVAHVEANEKCPRCESTNRGFRGTLYDGYGDWKCDDKWHDDSSPVAEPKPTPSTPVKVGSVAAYIGITEDQIKRFVGAMNMVGLEIVETASLPQPDSSSIPDRPSLSEDEILSSLYKYLRPEQVKPLIYSRTKDGIDCDYVTVELTQLVNAIISRAFAAKESK